MKKGDYLVYVSGHGNRFQALVLRAHRDGTFTVLVQWPLTAADTTCGCYQGDTWRIGAKNIVGPL